MKNKYSFSKIDFVGMVASLLCAVHCAATPVLMTVGALGGFAFLQDHTLESAILGISTLLAILSLIPSYLHKHHRRDALNFAVFGFLILGLSHWMGHELDLQYLEYMEAALSCLGGVMIAYAHWINHRMLQGNPANSREADPGSIYHKLTSTWEKYW